MLGFLVNQFGYVISERTAQALKPFGIGPRDLGILLCLDVREPKSQLELGQALRLDRTTIGHMIDRLESDGWLVRVARPEDRRLNALHLTPDGESRLKSARAVAKEVERELLSPLDLEDAEQLKTLVRTCLDHERKA